MLTSIFNINPLSACTLERSELSLVPLRVVHELIDSDVSFAGAIAYELARDLRKTTEDFKNDRLQTGSSDSLDGYCGLTRKAEARAISSFPMASTYWPRSSA